MSDYKPGQVAMVTYLGLPRRAFKYGGHNSWMVLTDAGKNFVCLSESHLTDITPLVTLDLTREDADLLTRYRLVPPEGFTTGRAYNLLNRITRAIREQTPEPEPPKRWKVYDDRDRAEYDLLWDARAGCTCGPFPKGDGQRYADVLNAAEATDD